MRLLFKCVCLTALNAWARDIVLVSYSPELALGPLKKDIGRLGIPQKLITYRATRTCPRNAEAIVHLCLKENSIKVVHADKEILESAFKVFGYGKDR